MEACKVREPRGWGRWVSMKGEGIEGGELWATFVHFLQELVAFVGYTEILLNPRRTLLCLDVKFKQAFVRYSSALDGTVKPGRA